MGVDVWVAAGLYFIAACLGSLVGVWIASRRDRRK